MKCTWLAFALSACAALAACDDETDPIEPEEVRIPDAGPLRIKVTNVGTGCSLRNRSCEGAASQCLEISFSGAFYPGGYCTADCKVSDECGASGVCPVGEAERVTADYKFRSTWARKCFQTCDAGSCRPGYACRSLAEVYLAPDAPAPMHTPVCVPSFPVRDAGARDAGAASDAGLMHSLDAGR